MRCVQFWYKVLTSKVYEGRLLMKVLSPLLFSLHINGVMTRLHDGKCGVGCGGDMVPGLLFADDISLVTSDKEGLQKSLDVLVKWCEMWGVKINQINLMQWSVEREAEWETLSGV